VIKEEDHAGVRDMHKCTADCHDYRVEADLGMNKGMYVLNRIIMSTIQ
jgi:hypothetical protein